VDAYEESEQRSGFFTMIEEHLAVPFETEVLGVMVTVEQIDLTETGEVVANCRRGRDRQSISILYNSPFLEVHSSVAKWVHPQSAHSML